MEEPNKATEEVPATGNTTTNVQDSEANSSEAGVRQENASVSSSPEQVTGAQAANPPPVPSTSGATTSVPQATTASVAASTNTATASTAAAEADTKEGSDSDDDDDEDVIEESPCCRYIKRKEEVKYRDVPGIDTAYLAMDTEEGVEVVWNEAVFSGTKKIKTKEEAKLKDVFEALTLIDHPNIVKFHRYWTDAGGTFNEKSGQTSPPRLVFITEFMSSGTLKQFLRKTKRNNRKIQVQSWKRWCTQILSALNYLHAACDSPILHGNLTCDTIFIQHNGLVKIGSVAPDIIHQNVKTCRDNIARNKHFLAPEWGTTSEATLNTAIDIYAFGMCALETAALELLPANPSASAATSGGSGSNGAGGADASANGHHHQNGSTNGNPDNEGSTLVTEESIQRTIDSLEDEMQKDFIRKCLRKKPEERPTAGGLLFHPVLFEVHSLKLLAAHILVNTPAPINETMTDEAIQTHYGRDTVMAAVKRISDGRIVEYKLSDFPVAEKLEKFMEDVKYGIYPLTAFALSQPPPPKTRAVTPIEDTNGPGSNKSETPDLLEPEDRWGIEFKCYIGPPVPQDPNQLTLLTKLCDGMNRQMQAPLQLTDTPEKIAHELLGHAIINWRDVPSIAKLMTMGFIQRANETAEYIAKKETIGDDANNHDGAVEVNDKPPVASVVQGIQPPSVVGNNGVEPENSGGRLAAAASETAHANNDEATDDNEIFEDPTPPQALEGRLSGLEPVIGTPQMTLGDAVAAGTTHGGLHFPKNKFIFHGVVAEVDQRLQDEIAEWQKRMQEYLVEQHILQQQQQQQSAGGSVQDSNPQPPPPPQNGAQINSDATTSNAEHQNEEVSEVEQTRSSSQLRE